MFSVFESLLLSVEILSFLQVPIHRNLLHDENCSSDLLTAFPMVTELLEVLTLVFQKCFYQVAKLGLFLWPVSPEGSCFFQLDRQL